MTYVELLSTTFSCDFQLVFTDAIKNVSMKLILMSDFTLGEGILCLLSFEILKVFDLSGKIAKKELKMYFPHRKLTTTK